MVDFRVLLDGRTANAAVAWLATGVLAFAAVELLGSGKLLWPAFALLVVGVVLIPPIVTRDLTATLPGELVVLVALPVALRALDLFVQATPFATMAGLALLVVLVLDAFTSLEMAPRFAVLFVVVTTMAFAGVWAMVEYASDLFLGTTFVEGQRELNLDLLTATLVGLLAGTVFGAYFRETDGDEPFDSRPFPIPLRAPTSASADSADESDPSVVDDAPVDDGVEESPTYRLAIRALQVVLVAIVGYSIVTVQWSLMINSGVPLALSFLPAIARWRYGYPMHAGLALLIALAATLHAVGALGPYQQTNWYGTVTHALSSTLIAGVGYVIAHSIELHTDRVSFSSRFRGAFIVTFVLAVGVLWELLEFTSGIVAGLLGGQVLAQYGVSDIVKDLTFNTIGALVVALWGTALFRRPARRLTDSVGELLQ